METQLQESTTVNTAVLPTMPSARQTLPGIVVAPDLYNYLDYRKYLADFYRYRREQTKRDLRPYNYAMFSAAANIKSPNYLKMIIEGKRNLSEDMIGKFAKAMGLQKDQTEELKLLVLYTQSTDPAERNILLKDLNEHRVQLKMKSGELDRKAWERIPSWVTWVLYTMLDQANVDFNPEALRKILRGKATIDEIQTALKALIDSGEVVKSETGQLKKAHSLMSSADEVPVALVRKLQAELMHLGLESLFQDDPTEREFGTATLCLTRAEFEEIRFQLRKMRKEIQKNNSVNRAISPGERTYQLNLQLFPVTE